MYNINNENEAVEPKDDPASQLNKMPTMSAKNNDDNLESDDSSDNERPFLLTETIHPKEDRPLWIDILWGRITQNNP